MNREGESIDVVPLLSSYKRDYLVRNNGMKVKVNTLRGKFVVICCFHLPIGGIYSKANYYIRALKATYSEWKTTDKNIEMVVIVGNRKRTIDKGDFKRFVSGFPSSCLTIPFWDSKSRRYVSKYLKFEKVEVNINGVVIDPDEKVLKDAIYFINKFGANSFPFTSKRVRTLKKEVKGVLKSRPVSLEGLLQCNPSDFLVCNDEKMKICVSDLKTKLVGLYLCYGLFMDKFIELYKRCLELGRELEMVLIYADDLDNFAQAINSALQEKGISSWWVLPFKENVSKRLWQFCETIPGDRLMIVGPNGKYFDPKAVSLIDLMGIDASYPYAVEAIVEQEISRLKALTLESVLVRSEQHNYLFNIHGARVPVEYLKGKNVLFCLAFSDEFTGAFEMVLDWHHDLIMKDEKNNPGIELVFASFNTEAIRPIIRPCQNSYSPMSWLTCPLDHDRQAFMIKQLFVKGTYTDDTFIAFGEDGRIVTIYAYGLIYKHAFGVSNASIPFPNNLCQDVVAEYTKLLL